MFGCKHKFEERSRVFSMPNPNRYGKIRIEDLSIEARERFLQFILFGVTSIVSVCMKCGKMESCIVVGNHCEED